MYIKKANIFINVRLLAALPIVCVSPLFNPNKISPGAAKCLRMIHLLRLGRWDDKLAGRCGSRHIGVVVNAFP